MEIMVRAFRESDRLALTELYDRIRRDEFPWSKQPAPGDFDRAAEGEHIFVAEADCRIAGFLSVWEPDKFLHSLFVSEKFRRIGVGQALIQRALSEYGAPLTLKCVVQNKNAVQFYTGHGWDIVSRDTGEEGAYYLMRLAKEEGSASVGPIQSGVEDKLFYVIFRECIACGTCAAKCPAHAIAKHGERYSIDPRRCIDCGTCAAVCPVSAPHPCDVIRNGISVQEIDTGKCCFNPGCALSLYQPEIPGKMLRLLQENFGDVKLHNICCRHDPGLEPGTTVINNCAGCDRRFRSLYKGIQTISYWEVLDGIQGLKLPDHSGMTVSIHDPCGYRHKPQVHRAVRSLLRKMNIQIVEAAFSGTESVCCGDNLYGLVPNDAVERRIQLRVDQFPCRDVAVYCIGCARAIAAGGKTPWYLPDLLLDWDAEPMRDTLDEYHAKIGDYIERH